MEGVKSMWTQPPAIKPNYGKPKSLLPKSSLTRVLLHDNVNHEHLLQVKLSRIAVEKRRSARLLELHRKSFVTQQSIKHQQLRAMGITDYSLVPDHVASSHYKVAKFVHREAAKELPLHHRIIHRLHSSNENTKNDDKQSNAASSILPNGESTSYVNGEREQITFPVLHRGHQKELHGSKAVILPKKPITSFNTTEYGLRREKTIGFTGEHKHAKSKLRHRIKRRNTESSVVQGEINLARLSDTRFSQLRKSLIPPQKPVDAYLQLSAGGLENIHSYDNFHKNTAVQKSFSTSQDVIRSQTF